MTEYPREFRLRVTQEELAGQEPQVPVAIATPTVGLAVPKRYGNIHTTSDAPVDERGSIFLKGWFYLGISGLLGTLAGWGLTEGSFVDGMGHRWGNVWMIPLLVALMCVGFAIAESIVERSTSKAFLRAAISLPLGIVLGFVFELIANVFYSISLTVCAEIGAHSFHNPSVWVARSLAWAVFGAAGGIVYGIVGQSMKRTAYGVLGGAIGAALGGLVFDPISFMAHGGAPSRAIGFALLGAATGISMGLVESALKHRWLYVTAGPLAGKQFILYKPITAMGSLQASDIYLFKDSEILPHHARLELHGSRIHLYAEGSVFVSGQPVRGMCVLASGATIGLGRYQFRYMEKARS